MNKSKIAIILVVIILACGVGGVTFAAYSSSRQGTIIEIETGNNVTLEIDTISSDIFKDENGAALVPREAHLLFDNGTFLNEVADDKGRMNKTALMGKINIKVEGATVNRLRFSTGKVLVYDDATSTFINTNEEIELYCFKNFNASFTRYDAIDGRAIPLNDRTAPAYLGAVWDAVEGRYMGGAHTDLEAAGSYVPAIYTFSIIVRFKNNAETISNLSNKKISFELNIEAL